MITIRKALPTEEALLVGMYQRERQLEDAAHVAREAGEEFAEIGTNRTIYFAFDGETLVGAIQLISTCEEKDLADGQTRALIHHLRVAKDHEGQGIAHQLYTVLEQEAKRRGVCFLNLQVQKDNTHARDIYTHWNFRFLREANNGTEDVYMKIL